MRKGLLALCLLAVPLFAQTPPVYTVTPTFVAVTIGTDLYCGLRPLAGQYQVYCFSTVATAWDSLRLNQISSLPFYAFSQGNTGAGTQTPLNTVSWLVFKDAGGVINWQIALNGAMGKQGTF